MSVGYQLGVGLHQLFYNNQAVGLDGAPGLCYLNNGVGKPGGNFALGGSPGELNTDIYSTF